MNNQEYQKRYYLEKTKLLRKGEIKSRKNSEPLKTDNPNYFKEYYQKNKEKISTLSTTIEAKEKQRLYNLKNVEKRRLYNIENKEKRKLYNIKNKERDKLYRLENKEKISEAAKLRYLKRKSTNILKK